MTFERVIVYGGRVVDFIAVAEPFEYGLLIEDHGRSSAIFIRRRPRVLRRSILLGQLGNKPRSRARRRGIGQTRPSTANNPSSSRWFQNTKLFPNRSGRVANRFDGAG